MTDEVTLLTALAEVAAEMTDEVPLEMIDVVPLLTELAAGVAA